MAGKAEHRNVRTSRLVSGRYERSRAGVLRAVCPVRVVGSIQEIDLEGYWSDGKRVLLLDVDHTLLPWRSNDIPPTTHEWLAKARALGFEMLVISNTRHPRRLNTLCEQLGLQRVTGKNKPDPRVFHQALSEVSRKPAEAVMIGDQLFTDILGANRCGIESVWVAQMSAEDFITTRALRVLERLVARRILRFRSEA